MAIQDPCINHNEFWSTAKCTTCSQFYTLINKVSFQLIQCPGCGNTNKTQAITISTAWLSYHPVVKQFLFPETPQAPQQNKHMS